jgi:dTDP-4-amino-4,6-dideoxygalactose transaminase
MFDINSPSADLIQIKDEVFQAIMQVIDGGNFILGPTVDEFERKFKNWNNSLFAVGVGSGTSALSLSLIASGVKVGDEVVIPANTALATAAAITDIGAIPVVIDVHRESGLIDEQLIVENCGPRTKAVIVVHLFGNPFNSATLGPWLKEKGIALIEDCAQAHGATINNIKVGNFGDFGCFSFYPTKLLGAIGDGGMITTKNQTNFERLLAIRQYGWRQDRIAQELGTNSRLDAIQAAILKVKIEYLDAKIEHRRGVYSSYRELLNHQYFQFFDVAANSSPSHHLVVAQHENRKSLLQKLTQFGINCSVNYPTIILDNPGYRGICKLGKGGTQNADYLKDRIFSLPIFSGIKPFEIEIVSKHLNEEGEKCAY